MSFDRLAPHYRWLEHALAGGVLQRARLAHLAALDGARSILLAGEGPGRFLAALRSRRPDARLTVVDASAAMLARARQVDTSPLTEYIEADLRTWRPPAGHFDALVTHCVLDCFGPATLGDVIARLAAAAQPAATWLVTDFTVPPRGWQRLRARGVHRLMYGAFRVATRLEATRLTPPDPWLEAQGFTLRQRHPFNHGLLQADHWHRDGNVG